VPRRPPRCLCARGTELEQVGGLEFDYVRRGDPASVGFTQNSSRFHVECQRRSRRRGPPRAASHRRARHLRGGDPRLLEHSPGSLRLRRPAEHPGQCRHSIDAVRPGRVVDGGVREPRCPPRGIRQLCGQLPRWRLRRHGLPRREHRDPPGQRNPRLSAGARDLPPARLPARPEAPPGPGRSDRSHVALRCARLRRASRADPGHHVRGPAHDQPGRDVLSGVAAAVHPGAGTRGRGGRSSPLPWYRACSPSVPSRSRRPSR
jgi:hypothetical protein